MTPSFTRRHLVLGSAASVLYSASRAQGDPPWPARPVKVIVPSGAGSVVDVLARQLYEPLGKALGQPFVIDNRPGANGLLGTQALKNAAPDGYTLLQGSSTATVMAEALNPELPVKTLRDLEPIALTAVGGVLLVVHPSVPANTLPELVELLRREPAQYPSYGSWGVGSNGHLTMEWIRQRTGITLNHVPYKTSPGLVTDIVGGVIPIGWVDLVSPLGFIQQGRLRGIAVNGNARASRLPDVKLMSEQGFPFPATGWNGVFAPKNTPAPILDRLHDAINAALSTPAVQEGSRRVNVEPTQGISRPAFAKIVENDLAVWRKIVVDGNIKPE
ncbi:tripartite tricarboxylate transporter substrate binding protein [Ottowia sp.]|jgi:tripartite-type tricarboxylate transporter receptor subunit TctC|uniref:Bug family tripartite tricarboxylate transporter substrate binding protein n=1 Tax=Ottowia sp. TaxID=1898956 RepID=UPI0025ED580D|nr:tripartite tricarboxylate transporter substrate binding protein [Ottowia sp.]MBK6615719.1 tripartite tricarboxylate transporter substrate binding protein [Ottowia sp.]MBK6746782.1 tripartite tricarboxylate transporter substrate binding protein [Ottowia sp.]